MREQTEDKKVNNSPAEIGRPAPIDPNDSKLLRDKLKGQTTEHADPPRLEDEGQSGG